MKSSAKITSVAAISALLLLTAGCDRKDENQTAGQTLDNTVAETRQESHEAANNAANNANSAANTVEQTTDNAVQAVDDATITASIKAKLVADDELKAIDINVDTNGGAVTLTGAAPNPAAIDRATTIAKSVDGVSNVNNQLTVKTN